MSDQRLLSLRDQITEEAPWLFSALGLSIVGEDFQPKSFGNSFVTLEGASIRVRFVRDRGQVWVDVAPRNTRNKWWHLLFVLEAVRGQLPEANYTLKHATTLLYDNFEKGKGVSLNLPLFRNAKRGQSNLAAPS